MGNMKKFAMRGSMILFLLCLIMLFIVDRGSAEFVVLTISMAINAVIFIVSFILIRHENKGD